LLPAPAATTPSTNNNNNNNNTQSKQCLVANIPEVRSIYNTIEVSTMASSPPPITTTPSSAGRTNRNNEDATAGGTAANKNDDNNDENQTETEKETETGADEQIIIDTTTTTTTSSSSRKRPRSGDTDTDAPIINNKNDDDDDDDNNYGSSVAAAAAALIPLLTDSLYGMLDGIPRTELKLIVSEAEECERALEEELHELKGALRRHQQFQQQQHQTTTAAATTTTGNPSPSVNVMLESEVTPPDHQWTLSALLGRLRHDLTTPLPPNSQLPALRERTGVQSLVVPKKKRTNHNAATALNNPGGGGGDGGSGDLPGVTSGRSTPNVVSTEDTQFQRLAQIRDHPDYVVEHDDTDRLLAVWRKVSTHRSSLVFRRPVNPKDAPGYTDKVHFPMDLSLIRKLILSRTIRSYRDFVRHVHLIGHNCVKYNGRESDYALVTREFESYASEYVLAAVHSHRNPLPVSGSGNVGRPSKQSKQQQQQQQQTTTTTTMMRTTATTNTTPTPTSHASLAVTAAAAAVGPGTSEEQDPKPESARTDKDTGGGATKEQRQQQEQQA
jgi:hypothetical protein